MVLSRTDIASAFYRRCKFDRVFTLVSLCILTSSRLVFLKIVITYNDILHSDGNDICGFSLNFSADFNVQS